ncbi:hypothetical protein JOM56_005042 [Amanita muscaria]
MEQGRLEESKKLEVQVVEERKAKLGVNHPDTLMGMSSLAATYIAQGLWYEAEDMLSKAVVMMEQVMGPEDPRTVQSTQKLERLRDAMEKEKEKRKPKKSSKFEDKFKKAIKRLF